MRRGVLVFRRVVMDEDEDVEMSNVEEEKEDKSDGDDFSDEDWGKNVGKEVCESEEDDVELDVEDDMMDEEELVEEKDEEIFFIVDFRKWKKISEVVKLGVEKKIKIDEVIIFKGFKVFVVEFVKKIGEGNLNVFLL